MDLLLVLVARWVGVVLAVGGTVVTAPDGWNLLWRGIAEFLRRWGRRLRKALARWLPWLRREETVHAPASGIGSVSDFATVTDATGVAWDAEAPLADKVERLRKDVEALRTHLNDVRKALRQERKEREKAIGSLERELRDDLQSVEAALHEHRRRAAEIDKRGRPADRLGRLLTGVPEQHLTGWSPWGGRSW